jgi:excisionase family DNA binding protein
MPAPGRHYTTKMAADYLGRSQAHVRDLCEKGKLKYFRRRDGRGQIRIPAWALEEFKAALAPEYGPMKPGAPSTRMKAPRKSIGRRPAPKPRMPERIPPGKAAQIVGVSNYILLKYAKRGEVPGATKIAGRLWRFELRGLRDWVRRREAERQRANTSSARGTRRAAPALSSGADIDAAYERLFARKSARRRARNY